MTERAVVRPCHHNNGGCATLTLPNVTRNHTGRYLCQLRKRQEFDQDATVIYEVPHEDSEVDGTSTSSSKGSSQWCQVPVYVSFDYFECVVESKGGG
ncbi:unnamed protein product [Gadus morhua 'NCC']